MMKSKNNSNNPLESPIPVPSLLRRFCAIFYDSVLLVFMLFLLTTFITLPFRQGEGIESGNILYQVYLISATIIFFSAFWIYRGQTIGMWVWRIRVQQLDGSNITWLQALSRFGLSLISWSLLGIGFWWALFDKENRAWHDRFSETQLILLPKPSKPDAS
ncbi:RDD family protein [Candidatus Nitrosacidococcus sp. I8]|uniref:RDD family protein n=1 Tax=Candidatus Nitrosacidococcus sp. I8 TaxID=2942908 RepID=UPI002226C146|nr:RDD family protein [Candidatus Nitrosacidococcus sp. I8]CAH9018127.1 hypothetical protein NURINAE_00743 [Candidatus Nitrosacidococcus sp. I8]